MTLNRRHLSTLGLAALLATTLAPTPASAQATWPAKAVRIVVPFAAGGTTDILARTLAPELQKAFGQPFVVDNKPGAGGNAGANEVAKSAPDGYTLLMGTVGTHAINAALYPKMPFDPAQAGGRRPHPTSLASPAHPGARVCKGEKFKLRTSTRTSTIHCSCASVQKWE